MAFDDEDSNTVVAAPTGDAQQRATPENVTRADDAIDGEEDEEGAPQDFRHFSSLFSKKKGVSSQTLRRGEKDFETHGTRAQEGLLEQSRRAMEDVLSYTRVHVAKNWCRGWYMPDIWEGHEASIKDREVSPELRKREVYARERVVGVDSPNGKWYSSMGSNIPNPDRSQPGWDRLWLLPEEALFLVERGSLDLWWPTRPAADIWPLPQNLKDLSDGNEEDNGSPQGAPKPSMGLGPDADYSLGVPLSLQAAYSLLIGTEGERGKVTLEKFQVYANLRRHGYIIFRAVDEPVPECTPETPRSLLDWLVSFVPSAYAGRPSPAPYGPLVRPGVYRSYEQVFKQLRLVHRHRPGEKHEPAEALVENNPFKIHYHVWKASTTGLAKTRPPPPDFYISVIDARSTVVPSLSEISALLEATPPNPPKETWKGHGMLYPRLKHGYRNVILAVVDHGIVNYIRFGEGAFGLEPISSRFDHVAAPKSGKRGGGGGGRGRGGGRGGRGRGRGRHRA